MVHCFQALLSSFAFKSNLRRYTVRVNSQTANLLAFQVRVAFDADVFEATACTQGSDWKAAW